MKRIYLLLVVLGMGAGIWAGLWSLMPPDGPDAVAAHAGGGQQLATTGVPFLPGHADQFMEIPAIRGKSFAALSGKTGKKVVQVLAEATRGVEGLQKSAGRCAIRSGSTESLDEAALPRRPGEKGPQKSMGIALVEPSLPDQGSGPLGRSGKIGQAHRSNRRNPDSWKVSSAGETGQNFRCLGGLYLG